MTAIAPRRRRLARALRLAPLLALAVPAAAGQGIPAEDPFASLVAAERGFAADAARIGVNPAFRAHVAADGILLRPDPRPAPAQLAGEPLDTGLKLEWQPEFAAVARSNDLGFTTGPYRMTREGQASLGRYLTVWQRDGTGKWRWYLDHGVPMGPESRPAAFPAEVVSLGAAAIGDRQAKADAELAAAEEALNAAIVRGAWGLLVETLAERGSLLRPRLGMIARGDAARLLAGRVGFAGVERRGMRLSRAGDLAASYGRLVRGPGKPDAWYVRIWRREDMGWRLLVDQLT